MVDHDREVEHERCVAGDGPVEQVRQRRQRPVVVGAVLRNVARREDEIVRGCGRRAAGGSSTIGSSQTRPLASALSVGQRGECRDAAPAAREW